MEMTRIWVGSQASRRGDWQLASPARHFRRNGVGYCSTGEPLFILQWRKARGLSQVTTARKAAISRQTLVNLEREVVVRPRMSTLDRLAWVFDCRTEQLFGPPPEEIKPFTPDTGAL